MKIFRTIFLSFLVAVVLSTQTSAQKEGGKCAKDLDRLRVQYQSEIAEAVEPVNNRHIHNLETLLKRATFDNDLATAVKEKRGTRARSGQCGIALRRPVGV